MENIISFSTNRSNFMKAFFEAKKNIGSIAKKRRNDHLKSMYANLSDYLEAIDSAIEEAGIVIIQSAGRFNAAGDMPMETRMEHVESGEYMVAVMEIHVDRKNAQGDGSAQSYARRFHIGSLFGLAAEDDDGNASKRKAKDYIKEFDLITDLSEVKTEARRAFGMLKGNETEQNLIHAYVAKREGEAKGGAALGGAGFNPASPRNATQPLQKPVNSSDNERPSKPVSGEQSTQGF